MREIVVNTKDKYSVYIGDIDEMMSSLSLDGSKVLVVTDSNVAKLYLDGLLDKIDAEKSTFVFEAGEKSKSMSTYENILKELTGKDFTRNDYIIAFGGGVVGDVAGFAAATYKRGIKYINIPTTLLSMIDSSVGGKCGVNFNGFKNYVGAFYQPSVVLIDPTFLKTLKHEELMNGMGEGIKYFALIGPGLTLPDTNNFVGIEDFIYECISYKATIVEKDERDTFERKLLNLGHTIAHAMEEDSNYEISHGIAVANGVLMMANASNLNHALSNESLQILKEIMDRYEIPRYYFSSVDDIKKYIFKDKKAVSDSEIDVIVISELGECDISRMDLELFIKYISKSIVYSHKTND